MVILLRVEALKFVNVSQQVQVSPMAVNFYPEPAKGSFVWPDFYPDKWMRLFANFLKKLSGQCYGINEKIANFYPDSDMGS